MVIYPHSLGKLYVKARIMNHLTNKEEEDENCYNSFE
mgnify:CR=1 FL=1